jgi:hypothetical protein
MFVIGLRHDNPRRQGDIGEAIAASWLTQASYGVWIPLGHSPDCDLVAELNRSLFRIQVKTATLFRKGRWAVAVCTRGGNQSWNGVVKGLEPDRFDYLFVVVGDWRCWLIPAAEVGGKTSVLLGGPKYARFEVATPPSKKPLLSGAGPMGEAGFEPA